MNLMPTPRFADLEITSRCNAHCRYCYYLNNEGVIYRDLPTRSWIDVAAELGRARVMQVSLAGGEPFLRRDLFDILDALRDNRMRFELLTNGSAVTLEAARRLRQTGRCSSIQVSLDGSTPEVHESMRGPGTWEPAMRAVSLLLEEELPVTVRVTVHPRNVDDLPALTRLLLEKIGLPSFSTNSVSRVGSRGKYPPSVFLSPSERLRAMRTLSLLAERYPGRIVASAGPLAEWRYFNAMEEARRTGTPIPGRGRLTGCGCVFDRLAVRADGAWIPCTMLPQMVLGYVGTHPLEEIWSSSPLLAKLRDRVSIPLSRFPGCRGCAYLDVCTGGCAGTALALTGEANAPSPESCLRLFEKELAAEGLSPWP